MKRLIASNLYKIYQIDSHDDLWRDVLMGSEWLEERNIELSIDDYKKVYELKVDTNNLEDIFKILNIHHPADYKARSLSVGDVVEHDGVFYFVDKIGFNTDVIK